jgi:dipeptidyl aminopeptidase/acylaminoacyl peptidase
MFEALKRQGHNGVQYVLYPDEGHSITRLANRLDYYSRAEQLLAEVLGGRREAPLRPKLSSAKVKAH